MYNALIHLCLNYAVLNWGSASKIAIKPLVILQTKAVKFLKTSNQDTLDEPFIQNQMLTTNKQFKIFAGKFMHSYKSNLLPSHFTNFSNLFTQLQDTTMVTQPNLIANCFARKSISCHIRIFRPATCNQKLTGEMMKKTKARSEKVRKL